MANTNPIFESATEQKKVVNFIHTSPKDFHKGFSNLRFERTGTENSSSSFNGDVVAIKTRLKTGEGLVRKFIMETFSAMVSDSKNSKFNIELLAIGDHAGLTIIVESDGIERRVKSGNDRKANEFAVLRGDRERMGGVMDYLCAPNGIRFKAEQILRSRLKNLGSKGSLYRPESVALFEKRYFNTNGQSQANVKGALEFAKTVIVYAGWAFEVKVISSRMDKLGEGETPSDLSHEKYRHKQNEKLAKACERQPILKFALDVANAIMLDDELPNSHETGFSLKISSDCK